MRSKIGPAALQTATYDPFLESQGVRVMHFPYQWYCATSMPSIFNPQDVQQFYHPEFFSKAEMRFRTSHYQKWCDACTLIDVPSAATKQDLIRFMGIAPGKVAVVPKASPLVFVASGIADLNATRKALHLPAQFMLFPAQTWPHKNHARLFEALAQLRDRENLRLHLVCTGRRNEHWSHLAAKVRELDLSSQVQFLDYVPAAQLKALYHLAEFTVFPTLFEGGGLPLLEAFCEGSPLACSAIPVLVEQTGDAALLFDPLSVEGIAAALRQLHADPQLRATLRERGLVVAQHYTWERTARTYRALYRKLGSSPLTDEDHALIRTAMT
jgi:glycosyltransferase involved in cell wall biosynthesis